MPVIELSLSGRPKSARVVGIDLGTTNSLIAYMSDKGPEVIRDKFGNGSCRQSSITITSKTACSWAKKLAIGLSPNRARRSIR